MWQVCARRCEPVASPHLFVALEGDGNFLLVHVGGDEMISVYLTVEGESHGFAIRVLVSRQGTTVTDGAPVVVVRGYVVHLKHSKCYVIPVGSYGPVVIASASYSEELGFNVVQETGCPDLVCSLFSPVLLQVPG